MKIGDRIKKIRTEKIHMSQVDLAKAIGVSKQTLYKYENNIVTNIPSDKIEAIAHLAKVAPGYIMGWEEPQAKTVTLADQQEETLHDNYCALTPSGRNTLTSYSSFLRAQNSAQTPAPDADLKAAHYREDIEVTDEMKKHDDDIMDDDDF